MNNRKKISYRYCIVPKCKSTLYRTPDKVFLHVPLQKDMREKWCKAINRDLIGPKSVKYVCEDHFDLENDTENLVKYKLVGGTLKIKPEVFPHKFDCQHGIFVSSSSSLQPFDSYLPFGEIKDPLHEYSTVSMAEQVGNIKLIQEVEKNPCLYDNKHKGYSKKNISEKTWFEVGKTFNLTGLQARKKWNNLRGVFRRNLKSSLSGSSSHKRPHYLMDAMQFIIPYTNVITSTTDKDVKYEDNETNDSSLQLDPLVLNSSVSIQSPSLPPVSPASRSSSPIPQRNAERKRQLNEIDKHLNAYFKSKISKGENVETKANKMFLLSLLPDLNNMSPRQIRIFKKKVIDVIENVMEE